MSGSLSGGQQIDLTISYDTNLLVENVFHTGFLSVNLVIIYSLLSISVVTVILFVQYHINVPMSNLKQIVIGVLILNESARDTCLGVVSPN